MNNGINFDGIFVRDGKVVLRDLPKTCEAGSHIFNKGEGQPCDCGGHKSFAAAEIVGCAEAPLSQEPVLRKKHLALILGGKK